MQTVVLRATRSPTVRQLPANVAGGRPKRMVANSPGGSCRNPSARVRKRHTDVHPILRRARQSPAKLRPGAVIGYRTMALVHQKLYQSQDLEDVYVLIDTAIPFGLVFEELVTNAFRHAFAGGRGGSLRLRLHRDEDGRILLRVSDNGVGLTPGFDPRRDGRLGLEIVFALSEQQLGGEIDITSVDGVTFSRQFKDNLYSQRA